MNSEDFLLLGSIISLRGDRDERKSFDDKFLLDKCTEVKRILISSINTAKQNTEKVRL